MRTDCDRRWEIDALREGSLGAKDAEAFGRHSRGCDVCGAAIARDARLRELVALLPAREPNELDVRRLRARVLHDVATEAPARRTAAVPLAVALAFALLAASSWMLLRGGSPSAPLVAAPPSLVPGPSAAGGDTSASSAFVGVVSPAEGARWTRARQGLTERVRLEEGALRIHVPHRASGERFLVELPDGELEVRGTTFEVDVRAGATRRVHVVEGVVSVRVEALDGGLELRAGETWNAPQPAPAASAPPPAARLADRPPPPKSEGVPPSASPPRAPPADDGAEAYAAAIALVQGGQYSQAASALRAFLLAHPRSPQAEDASFLEAAALARAGRPDAAALVAEDHLARFPKSFHRKEAAILIARAARDRGDCAQARAVLAPWLGGPADDELRATLKRCADDER